MTEAKLREGWAEFVSGNDDALAMMFEFIYPQLYRYGLRLCHREAVVKDSIQDTFLHFYDRRASLPMAVTNVQSYFNTAFRRNLMHRLTQIDRTGARRQKVAQLDADFVLGPESLIIEGEDKERRKNVLSAVINQLPPRQREIIYLKYYQGQSITEISNTLAITYQTVANSLHRALKKLRGSDGIKDVVKTALLFASIHVG